MSCDCKGTQALLLAVLALLLLHLYLLGLAGWVFRYWAPLAGWSWLAVFAFDRIFKTMSEIC